MNDDIAHVNGSSAPEIAQLDAQAALLDSGTALLLGRIGIEAGQRVLDLGTGLGDVAFTLTDIVGPTGSIVGIHQDPRRLAAANAWRDAAGLDNVSFVQGEAGTYRDEEPFDAIVARLLLLRLPNPAEVIAHHTDALRKGGRLVAIDYDKGSIRSDPEIGLISQLAEWITAAFRATGQDALVWTRLARLLRGAGLTDVATFGVQNYYLTPEEPRAASFFTEIVRSMAPAIIGTGVATEDDLGLDTLRERIELERAAKKAVLVPPTLVAAWGVRGG
jgi:SAM-dependent methyltransferase